MNCPKCGIEITEGHQFCMNCGYSLIRETGQEPEDGEEQTARRRRSAPEPEEAPEEVPEEAAEEPVREAAPPQPVRLAPAQRPVQARPVQAPRPGNVPPARFTQPIRTRPDRSAPPETYRKYRRGSGKGVLFWLGVLVLVLAAAYVGMCILMPDHELTAPAVNLALTVWNYFKACGNYLLWFPIALGAVILLAILKATAGKALHRKLHEADTNEAQDLARKVVVAETLAPPQQVYAEIDEALNTRKTRKRYFPKGKFEYGEFTGGSVPLEYSHGDDGFTANFVFQRMERTGTRIFLEIIEWQIVNDAVSGHCLQAMRGLEPMLRDVVLDIDGGARFQVYDR